MKKEIIACALLLTLAARLRRNIRYLNRLCTQLDDAAAQAEACCARHDTDSAAEARARRPNAGTQPRAMPTVCCRMRAQTP